MVMAASANYGKSRHYVPSHCNAICSEFFPQLNDSDESYACPPFIVLRIFGSEPNVLARLNSLRKKRLAPRVGFEPTACRLTAECSTVELPGNCTGRNDRINCTS